ncbi:hypothetical protein VB713_20440 [Anabaena cylindrica UHCC 0172]|uniref:hypothetical protein n=1 Tax=Anabaena cylindrica TaxID=1165 RepID=UPI002B20971F|nr:hypothetical protein [Anabaena cylindrica]MEA5553311.1 hypothetical protein [Anabaena cylindrica UHCC 0172]
MPFSKKDLGKGDIEIVIGKYSVNIDCNEMEWTTSADNNERSANSLGEAITEGIKELEESEPVKGIDPDEDFSWLQKKDDYDF